ncbi:MAG: GNAT family N-acetyltransferase [Nocardioidaceae bacterium]
MTADYLVRPMTQADVPAVERLTDAAWFDLDTRTHRTGWPQPEHRSDASASSWSGQVRHDLRHDPRGCWVAEDDSGLLGAALSKRRETTWLLPTYAVLPGLQGRGIGRTLLDAALAYGAGTLHGMIASSEDPLAVRRYRLAGFTLHPAMLLWGTVPRAALPVVERVREGSLGDVDLMDSVDRQTRGAGHGVDHEAMAATHRLVVVDRSTGSGYAYVRPGGSPYLLAATNRRTASDLLWESLAATSPDVSVSVDHLTAANEWAIDVGMACRMALWTRGYLALRGLKPPTPYLHSGHFL